MKELWQMNLENTKNNTLLGDVGEAIALHYLSSHGFYIVTRPIKFLKGGLFLVSAHYQIRPPKMDYGRMITDEQKTYLEQFPSWDYVAFKQEGTTQSVLYLIEVKTIIGKEEPHKKPKLESISKAKSLGFKAMLIIVRLLENWNVSAKIEKL